MQRSIHQMIAAVEIIGCMQSTKLKLQQDIKLSPGRTFDIERTRETITNLQRSGEYSYLGFSSIVYPGFEKYTFITIDAIESGRGMWTWNESPKGRRPVHPKLVNLAASSSGLPPMSIPKENSQVYEVRIMIDQYWADLANSLSVDHRANERFIAARLLGWATPSHAIVSVLLNALADCDSNVRNEAARSLLPACHIQDLRLILAKNVNKIIQLLHGPSATDRNKALALLDLLIDMEAVRSVIAGETIKTIKAIARTLQPNNYILARLVLSRCNVGPPESIVLIMAELQKRYMIARSELHVICGL